LLRFIPTW